jgi:hypothetical protein
MLDVVRDYNPVNIAKAVLQKGWRGTNPTIPATHLLAATWFVGGLGCGGMKRDG